MPNNQPDCPTVPLPDHTSTRSQLAPTPAARPPLAPRALAFTPSPDEAMRRQRSSIDDPTSPLSVNSKDAKPVARIDSSSTMMTGSQVSNWDLDPKTQSGRCNFHATADQASDRASTTIEAYELRTDESSPVELRLCFGDAVTRGGSPFEGEILSPQS